MKKINLSTFETFKHIEADAVAAIRTDDVKRMQKDLLEMMKDIIHVCEQHGFYYVLGGGSALGAVRHHGFIPWDDDIDLNMKREDIDDFIRVMKEEYSGKYWIRSPQETENYGLLFVQVRKKGTSVKTRDDYWNQECGLCVDIFPIENTYDNPLMRFIHKCGCYYYGLAVSCRKFWRDREFLSSLAKNNSSLKIVVPLKCGIGFLLSWRSLDTWVRKADRWYSRCKDRKSSLIDIPSGRNHFAELYPRSVICEKTEMDFEDIKAACPAGYDAYLTKMYGDYRKMPRHGEEEHHVYYKPFYLE